MEQNINVSIIMPVYNSGEYLKTAVESILYQADNQLELILVDDGSTDGSSERCDEYAAKDMRVVVIHQENGGICRARNTALKVARGEYIGFSDHDDEFLPNMYKKCMDEIAKYNPDMLKFGKRIDFIDKDNKTYRQDFLTFGDDEFERDYIVSNYMELRQKSMFRFVWDGWFKRSIIEKNKIEFDTYYKYGGEDHEFCNVFSRYTNSIRTISDIFYIHYLRSAFSTSAKKVDFLYYKEEGRRLNQTLDLIGYKMEGKSAIYFNQMFESIPFSIARYYMRMNTSENEIIRELKSIKSEGVIRDTPERITLVALMRQSKKISLFAYLYYKGYYRCMLKMCKLRYKIFK